MTAPKHAAPGKTFSSFAEFYQNSAYAAFPQEHRRSGSLGATMIEVRQPAIDLINAPVPDYVFIEQLDEVDELLIDIGDGANIHRSAKAACLHAVPPNTEARFQVSCPHTIRCLSVPASKLARLFEEHGLRGKPLDHFYASGHSFLPKLGLSQLMDTMWRMAESAYALHNLYFDGLLLQLLAGATQATALSPVASGRPEDTRIARVIDFIEAHLSTGMNITELAAVAAMSPSHFSKCFKATTGEPVWTYVQRRRCERACERLQHTREPIAHIAYACGFANQGHLTNALRKVYGLTPSAIRKN